MQNSTFIVRFGRLSLRLPDETYFTFPVFPLVNVMEKLYQGRHGFQLKE